MKYPKHPGVYSVTHIDSGRRYIGSAKNIYSRWRFHKSSLRRNVSESHYLQNAWNKYGEAAFHFEVLEACLRDSVILAVREQHWMDKFKGKLLNCRRFAEPAYGVPQTPENKAKARQRMMGNKHGEGTHYHGQLTEANVKAILTRYATGESREILAAEFKTHAGNISRIASRKIWWRVEVPTEIDAACRERTKHRARGARNPGAKLHQHVAEIKARLAKGERPTELAREYGVNRTAISAIKHGRSYNY